MKTYSITMTVSINVNVDAKTMKEAKEIALGSLLSNVSEFDRRIDTIEEITLIETMNVKKGIGSY